MLRFYADQPMLRGLSFGSRDTAVIWVRSLVAAWEFDLEAAEDIILEQCLARHRERTEGSGSLPWWKPRMIATATEDIQDFSSGLSGSLVPTSEDFATVNYSSRSKGFP